MKAFEPYRSPNDASPQPELNSVPTAVEILPPAPESLIRSASLAVPPQLTAALADLRSKVAEVLSIPKEAWPAGRRVKFQVPLVCVLVPESVTVTIENSEDNRLPM